MSLLLEILRCVLCCVEDNSVRNDYEPLYRNTSQNNREIESDASTNYTLTYGSQSNSSANTRSTYTKSVYGVVTGPYNSFKYVSIPSSTQPASSSTLPTLPKPSFEKLLSSNPNPSRPKTPTFSSTQCQSPTVQKIPSTAKPSALSPVVPFSPSKPSPQAPSDSLTSSPSIGKNPTTYSKPSPSFPSPTVFSTKPARVLPEATSFYSRPPPSSSGPSPSSSRRSPSAPKTVPYFKPTLLPDSSNLTEQQNKANYILVQKDTTPIYVIPKDIQDLIKRDEVPEVLKRKLSLSTYKEYFATLLYAEDYYIEKWNDFKLEGITLKLQQATISKRLYSRESYEKDDKIFVAFEIKSSREKRPFLLSRDFVFARPSGSKTEPFQGIIYRVERSKTVLVEFGEDFHAQYYSSCKYDVSFSFNRVSLKRAHQAIEAASYHSLECFIFPGSGLRKVFLSLPNLYYNNELSQDQNSAVRRIITIQGSPPYLIEGPLCVSQARSLSTTGSVIRQAVLEIYRSSRKHRILICAPINNTCDVLMTSLSEIPESKMFRANAAFREIEDVPTNILASSLYNNKSECFACPPLEELRKYRVILSTYISSFRLCNEGIAAGHFSHIFMVDASSACEPEAMVALTNLANENTAVIVTGSLENHPGWVRSDIARKNGLMVSYFKRLRERNPYNNLDPNFITKLAC